VEKGLLTVWGHILNYTRAKIAKGSLG
jgi:hypothetical protein